MILRDFHIHTTFSDGIGTPEEMVKAAIKQGMTEIGFSDHSPTPFDPGYCMSEATLPAYRAEILRLRARYDGQIAIRLGIERDFYTEELPKGFDYTIGSVHYVRFDAKDARGEITAEGIHRAGDAVYVSVDWGSETLKNAADVFLGGDIYALCERYFETVAQIPEKMNPSFIGHFDLITRENERDPLFDEMDSRYVSAWKKAADKLLKANIPFEINTGAMSRGAKTDPYPTKPARDYLRARGASFLLSSDSHRPDTLRYRFNDYEAYVL